MVTDEVVTDSINKEINRSLSPLSVLTNFLRYYNLAGFSDIHRQPRFKSSVNIKPLETRLSVNVREACKVVVTEKVSED